MAKPIAHISFDYASTGTCFLRGLQQRFDYPILHSEPFEALVDSFANDLAKHSFGPVATLIAGDGLELWKIDFAEETVHMAVVPAASAAAFKAYWTEGFLDDPDDARHFRPSLRRIHPSKATRAYSASPRQAKRTMAADTVRLPAEPAIAIERATALLFSRFADHPDNGSYFDFSVWPPVRLSLPAMGDASGFAEQWRPVLKHGDCDIWALREPRDPAARSGNGSFKLARVEARGEWTPRWLGGGASVAGRPDRVQWMGDRLVHVAHVTDERGKDEYEVLAISEHATESWYGSRKPLHVYPFDDGTRCVIVEGDAHLAIAEGPVTREDFLRLPKPLYNPAAGVIALGRGMVVFFTGTRARLRMHRLDLATMAQETCLLKHFGHSGVDRGTPYSTFGNLEVQRGHDDWWILNHSSNQFGKIDIALLWVSNTLIPPSEFAH